MIDPVTIAGKNIGSGYPCFIIAEAGVNHNGDIHLAHKLIDAAVKARADAVKFQSFITEELTTLQTPMTEYQIKTTGKDIGQYKMLKSLELTADHQAELKKHCEDAGIIYLCTPYERFSVDILCSISVAGFKIAATDVTNVPFLRYIAGKGLPIILSVGMSTMQETELAVNTLYDAGAKNKLILLHCTSAYPSPVEDCNLRVIASLQNKFNCPVGFSDHTVGIYAAQLAAAAGACLIEKHFTLSRDMSGPDHKASLEPNELADLVNSIRRTERMLGDGIKRITPSEAKNKYLLQKSIVAGCHMKAGEIITADKIVCKRPGTGLSPAYFDSIIGKCAKADIAEGQILTYDSIKWDK